MPPVLARVVVFQSAPDLTAGRCVSIEDEAYGPAVSIRARPYGRAMRTLAVKEAVQFEVSIRARPYGRAMRHDERALNSHYMMFQSAPDLTAGRCWPGTASCALRSRCFNPRPTLRPGDAAAKRTYPPSLVFQSAPDLTAGRCSI